MEYVPETVYCVMKRFGAWLLALECQVVVVRKPLPFCQLAHFGTSLHGLQHRSSGVRKRGSFSPRQP